MANGIAPSWLLNRLYVRLEMAGLERVPRAIVRPSACPKASHLWNGWKTGSTGSTSLNGCTSVTSGEIARPCVHGSTATDGWELFGDRLRVVNTRCR
jgi:hypothetical protein